MTIHNYYQKKKLSLLNLRQHLLPGRKWQILLPIYTLINQLICPSKGRPILPIQSVYPVSTAHVIRQWLLALSVCLILGIYHMGYHTLSLFVVMPSWYSCFLLGLLLILPYALISIIFCLFWDWLRARLHQTEMNPFILVMALTLLMMIPPTLPYWQYIIGIGIGFLSAWVFWKKTEHSPIHPVAMTMIALFILFPHSFWGPHLPYTFFPSDWFLFKQPSVPLTELSLLHRHFPALPAVFQVHNISLSQLLIGNIPGSIGHQAMIGSIFGAYWLIQKRLIDWRIPLSCGLTLFFISFIASFFTKNLLSLPLLWHFGISGLLFLTIFILSDGKIAPVTQTGKWIYGSLFAAFVLILRMTVHDYVDVSIGLVAIMGICSPAIDFWVTTMKKKT